MSDQPRSPSRRALLKMAGIAPFALAAGDAPSAVEIEAAMARVPDPIKVPMREKALARNWGSSKRNKADLVTLRLWTFFELGVADEVAVARDAYPEMIDLSGEKVLDNMDQFPTDGDDDETIACAVKCGVLAAQIAKDAGTEITAAVFRDACNHTKICMFANIDRVNKRKGPGSIKALAC